MQDSTIIRFNPPLPCSGLKPTDANPDATCGAQAWVGYAWENTTKLPWPVPGLWLVQPFCPACVKALQKVYKENGNAPDQK